MKKVFFGTFRQVLFAGLGLVLTVCATAQTYTNLYSFKGIDGANPEANLILSGQTLFGTTAAGGAATNGTIYAINTDRSGFTNLHTFSPIIQVYEGTYTLPGSSLPLPLYAYANADGATPKAGLLLLSNVLYGTAATGGCSNDGTIFALHTDGSAFTNLHNFIGGDGATPVANLILSSNRLLGTTSAGGSAGHGVVFAVNTDGTGFTILHSFSTGIYNPNLGWTNGDGIAPVGGLVLAGTAVYGTASAGGVFGAGTIFAIGLDQNSFTNLYNFTGGVDGRKPSAGLLLSGNTLFGTTRNGGSAGNGTVFGVNANGTGFTNLYSFTADESLNFVPNSDGSQPLSSLITIGNSICGTTSADGNPGVGTLFAFNTNSFAFSCLYRFGAVSGTGWAPVAGLVFSNNIAYGTTQYGGAASDGAIFAIPLPLPQINITSSTSNVILTWATNAIGCFLESSSQLGESAAWSPVSSSPGRFGSGLSVTNPVAGSQRFYRLNQ